MDKELFEKFANHGFPDNAYEDRMYLEFVSTNNFKWSSYPYFKRQIREYLTSKYDCSHTILDIGCGCGTYCYLLRGHYTNIDGIEADKEIIEKAKLEDIYRRVFNIDACEFEFDHYDIITMGDCMEHIDYERAIKLVKYLYDRCKELIIIIPYNLPLDECPGKPYSSHKQPDLAPDNMKERYPMLSLLWGNEYIGVYVKDELYNNS